MLQQTFFADSVVVIVCDDVHVFMLESSFVSIRFFSMRAFGVTFGIRNM